MAVGAPCTHGGTEQYAIGLAIDQPTLPAKPQGRYATRYATGTLYAKVRDVLSLRVRTAAVYTYRLCWIKTARIDT